MAIVESQVAGAAPAKKVRNEFITFAVLLVAIVGGLLIAYWYDRQYDYFSAYASQFYNWLIN